jgi:hypothetical protein
LAAPLTSETNPHPQIDAPPRHRGRWLAEKRGRHHTGESDGVHLVEEILSGHVHLKSDALVLRPSTAQHAEHVARSSAPPHAHHHRRAARHAAGFAQDFDSELTRAYLLFQIGPLQDGQFAAARVAALFDRWQATARYPRMIKDVYLVPGLAEAGAPLQRFNMTTRFVEPAGWPESMGELHAQLLARNVTQTPSGMRFLRTLPAPVWDTIPALVVPAPVVLLSRQGVPQAPVLSYTVLLLDREYLTNEMLPALSQQHFRGTGDGFDYQVAVVNTGDRGIVYHSAAGFSPAPDAKVDATMDLFQVRMQDFGGIAAEVRRFVTTFSAKVPRDGGAATVSGTSREEVLIGDAAFGHITPRDTQPFSIFVRR